MVVFIVFVVVGLVVSVAVVIILCQRNLLLKFGQNWVNNKQCIVLVVIVLVFLFFLIQTPSFKTWSKSGHFS